MFTVLMLMNMVASKLATPAQAFSVADGFASIINKTKNWLKAESDDWIRAMLNPKKCFSKLDSKSKLNKFKALLNW